MHMLLFGTYPSVLTLNAEVSSFQGVGIERAYCYSIG